MKLWFYINSTNELRSKSFADKFISESFVQCSLSDKFWSESFPFADKFWSETFADKLRAKSLRHCCRRRSFSYELGTESLGRQIAAFTNEFRAKALIHVRWLDPPCRVLERIICNERVNQNLSCRNHAFLMNVVQNQSFPRDDASWQPIMLCMTSVDMCRRQTETFVIATTVGSRDANRSLQLTLAPSPLPAPMKDKKHLT